jgi:hypothetical protein
MATTPMARRFWQLGTLLPGLMALVLVGDLAGRFLPLDFVAFRVWEPALRTTLSAPGPFEPGKVVRMRQAYGDLASMGNLRGLRQYHDEEFHVDRLGFRNGYDIDRERYLGIVTGDSFIVGHAEPEAETLSGQLTRLAGARFYNAGFSLPPGPPLPDPLASLAETLKLRPGVAIYELLERQARIAPPARMDAPVVSYPPGRAVNDAGAFEARFLPRVHRLSPWVESPLHIETLRFLRWFQDDVFEPNGHTEAVVRRQLPGGDEMLFIPWDLGPVGDPEPLVAAWSDYLTWYAQKVRQHDLQLVVLLVPNKYTVYGPLTVGGPREPEGARLLAGLADRLRASGLPVVDATPLFTAQAAERLPRHEYLYWRDDTHWNAEGIELAAEAVWREIQSNREWTSPASPH